MMVVPSLSDPQLAAWRFDEIAGIADIARFWAQRTPEAVALIDGERRRTYAELDERSTRIASRLTAIGAGPGSLVGYFGRNAIEFWETWFGASKSGCAIAPFNWRCTVAELIQVFGDARPVLIVVEGEFVATIDAVLAGCGERFPVVAFSTAGAGYDAWLAEGSPEPVSRVSTGEEIALVSFTSGTTGLPKGVATAQAQFGWSFLCTALEPALAWRKGDVMLMAMPNFHLGGSWLSLYALLNGKTLCIVPQFTPDLCLEAFARHRVSVAPMVPAAIQVLIDHPAASPEAFAALRSIIYFGSPIGQTTLRRARDEIGCDLIQVYGTTEANFLTILRPDDHLAGDPAVLASCGRALPLCTLRVVDRDGEMLAAGTVGEVEARSPMAFAGYLGRPEATAETWRDGWYRTGDLGRMDDAGYLTIVDRAKDMIITGGENVYSAEVEAALGKLAGVRLCAVIGLPDARWGEAVTAAIVADPAAGLTEADTIAHCRALIAGYKTPKRVLFRDSLPQTPTGKVRKADLRRLLANEGGAA